MDAWNRLSHRISEIESLHQAAALLSWDQQTMMPAGGAAGRAQQMSTLTAISHERTVADEVQDWLDALDGSPDLSPLQSAAVARFRRKSTRARRVPVDLVRALSKATATGMGAWVQAKQADDFALFAPALTEIVSLVREAAACHEPVDHPYDALLEEFAPGSTVAELQPMFGRLGTELSAFVAATKDRPGPDPLDVVLDEEGILDVGKQVIAALGFRMQDGRLDTSVHPFTVGVTPHDVRLTTHSYADDLLSSLAGTIHECGHGLYEQGLPDDWGGTGIAAAAGVGLHESQSRFWENIIGRSRPFFGWLVGVLKARWPEHAFDAEVLYGAANRVCPSLVRIKSDEATYNLHIILRFQLELALMTGDLQVQDLPGAWNDRCEALLGIRPATLGEGCLQDVHWSHGYLGYFPSYTIGNLYSASFKKAMEADLPDLWDRVAGGDFAPALGWLRDKVHTRGALVDAPEVFRDAVGERDPVADLMDHLHSRHGALVGL